MAFEAPPRFEPVDDWLRLPDGMVAADAADVGVDSFDRVHVLTRGESRVIVFDTEGRFITSWGEDQFSTRPHGLTIGPDDEIYLVDEGANNVRVLAADGTQTAAFGSGPSADGGPFNGPTKVAVADWGDKYISDGYGQARLHRFSSSNELIRSWGHSGTGDGEFNIPHSVSVDRLGRILIADRENDRIQLFDREGDFLGVWMGLHRPMAVVPGTGGYCYVAEGGWFPRHVSPINGRVPEFASRITIVSGDGLVVGSFGNGPGRDSKDLICAHGLALDSHGDLYVAEIIGTALALYPEYEPSGGSSSIVKKFRRVG